MVGRAAARHTTGALQIDYGDKAADAKLPFATELVASVIVRTARDQELPDAS